MPIPKPLTRQEAVHSLAHRLAHRVDRVRQFSTKYGVRPYRVFLVWTEFAGTERGEGTEHELKRIEILPTPVVESLDQVMLTAFAIGAIPVGTLRLRLVSAQYTEDLLTGHWFPEKHEDKIPVTAEFYYEIRMDGRGDPVPQAHRYRLAAKPHLRAGEVGWRITLERVGTDHDADASTGGGLNPCE
jgi:hypothetical protein